MQVYTRVVRACKILHVRSVRSYSPNQHPQGHATTVQANAVCPFSGHDQDIFLPEINIPGKSNAEKKKIRGNMPHASQNISYKKPGKYM